MSHPTRPLVRWLALPRAGIGYLQVGDELYQVREIDALYPDGSGCRVWQLETQDGRAYCVEPTPDGLACGECGRGCEHCHAISVALELIERRRLAEAARLATIYPY